MEVRTKRFLRRTQSYSCSMPGVFRAVAFCAGAAVVFHSPRGCAHVARTMDIASYYRSIASGSGENIPAVPLFTTQLEEKQAIFGGIEKLRECLLSIIRQHSPQCIVIANSCMVGVIGDDVEAVAQEIETLSGVPILTSSTCGFLDGEYYGGYFTTAEKLVERFFKIQPHEKNTALLLGDSGGPWGHYAREVSRLLRELGVTVIGQFPSYVPIKRLQELSRAQAVIPLGGRGQIELGMKSLAELLQQNYGLEYIPDVYPVGWQATKCWISAMGELFSCKTLAAALYQREEERLHQELSKFLPVTSGKKAVLCIGRYLSVFDPTAVLQVIRQLHLSIIGIVLLPAYSAEERQKMLAALHLLTDAPVYDADKGAEVLLATDIILTTHELKGQPRRQLFLPMVPKVGVSGEISLMRGIYRTLCSKRQQGGMSYV